MDDIAIDRTDGQWSTERLGDKGDDAPERTGEHGPTGAWAGHIGGRGDSPPCFGPQRARTAPPLMVSIGTTRGSAVRGDRTVPSGTDV